MSASEFLKWCEVFHVLRDGEPPPPGYVSLQIAYDGGGNILLTDGFPVNITDSALLVALNLDPGSRKAYTDYNVEARGGITSHTLNQPIVGSVTVSQNELDRVNVNSTNNAYVFTFPVGDSFENGSELGAVQQGVTGSITLSFPTGVFVNGIQNKTIVINEPYQNVIVRRISSSNWMVVYQSPGLVELQEVYDDSSLKQIKFNEDGLLFLNEDNSENFSFGSGENVCNVPLSFTNLEGYVSTYHSNRDSHLTNSGSAIPINVPTYLRQYNGVNDNDLLPPIIFGQEEWGYICKVNDIESGFYKLDLKSGGSLYNPFGFFGATSPTSDPKLQQFIGYVGATVNQFMIGSSTSQNYISAFEVYSPFNNRGSRPFPVLTQTDINSIDISTANQTLPVSLGVYNSDIDCLQYLTSESVYKTILPIQNIDAGDNISLDTSVPGRISISATGGGSGFTADYGSYSVNNNSVSTVISVANTFYPITGTTNFLSLNNSNFTSSLTIVAGVSTPTFTYLDNPTQTFQININLSVRGAVAVQNKFVFALTVVTSLGVVTATTFRATVVLQDLVYPYNVPLSGVVTLSQGDKVIIQCLNENAGNNVLVQYINATINNFSGSLPNVYSSIYTPTFTAVAGISGTPTLIAAKYSRNGNIINYSVQGTMDVTDAIVTLGISLPVSSTFSSSSDAIGSGSFCDIASPTAIDGSVNSVIADVANARLQANIISTIGSGTKSFTLIGQYQVI